MPKRLRMERMGDSTAGRIMSLLRRRSMTVDELADALELSGNAIRPQLALLERDGLVQRSGIKRGPSKPSRVYGLTPETELLYSRAYVPVLSELLHVLAARLTPVEFDGVMREMGRRLIADRPRPTGDARQRAEAAGELLVDLGGLARVEAENGGLTIRSDGCPLAAATQRYPEACNAMESLLSEFTGLAVTKCCDRGERSRCCFVVGG